MKTGLLPNGPLGTNFNQILVEIQNFSFMKMHLKISSVKWRPFCPGHNVLTQDKMVSILQTTFSDSFSALNIVIFWLEFYWNLFPRGPLKSEPTFVEIMAWQWTGNKPYYLKQCWLSLLIHIYVTRSQWVKQTMFKRGPEVGNPLGFLIVEEFLFLHP